MKEDYANGKRFNQKYLPLIEIPVHDISPSSLHIFLGVVVDVLVCLEKLAQEIGKIENFENIYQKYRIEKKSVPFGTFNGTYYGFLICKNFRQ